MAKICVNTNCKAEIPSSATYCPFCGTQQAKEEELSEEQRLKKRIQELESQLANTKSGVAYAPTIVNGEFKKVTDEPANDSIFEIHYNGANATFTLYSGAYNKVEANPMAYLEGCDKQILNSEGPVIIEREGTATSLPEGRWIVQQRLHVRVGHNYESREIPLTEQETPTFEQEVPIYNRQDGHSKGMFKHIFSFHGRIRRLEYGLTYLVYVVYSIPINIIPEDEMSPAFAIIWLLLLVPICWGLWAQGAKRCHDIGHSGWWQLIPFYFFWMIFEDGQKGINQYGENPKGEW